MVGRTAPALTGGTAHGRCRCGHLPTHHMVVVATSATANFRLEPSGPCVLCGEAGCRKYVPAGA
ncbi:MAG TPA: hypothetical protein VEH57_03480 [Thermoplasmata archaeon]|nr:hypothetical protein [Thermoplasmata archaeon]